MLSPDQTSDSIRNMKYEIQVALNGKPVFTTQGSPDREAVYGVYDLLLTKFPEREGYKLAFVTV